jgi:hypothetical protein
MLVTSLLMVIFLFPCLCFFFLAYRVSAWLAFSCLVRIRWYPGSTVQRNKHIQIPVPFLRFLFVLSCFSGINLPTCYPRN